ncbi:MAG: protein kinase [Pseudomonadota bacterium]
MNTTITGYRIEEFLGSGGIADVHKAVAEADGRVVAVKILREPERSRANVRRFLREGYLLQRLDHPGLPRCFGVVEEPRPALVLELLEGGTLSERLSRNGAVASEQVFLIALEMLRVLGYLHARGVIHRDVKSSNIHLGQDGRVLLLDLGLAMDPEDPFTTTLGDVMGTYAYMAPEQIAGAAVDPRSDLYSLGITLYEALCGRRPFSARGTAGYLRAHRAGSAQPLAERVPDAPIRLMEFIHQLMARDPSARPASAGIAAALLTGREGGHNELRPPPLVGRWGVRGAIEAVIDAGGLVHVVGEIGAGTGRVARTAMLLAHEAGLESLALRFRPWGAQHRLLPQLANGLALILGAEVPETVEATRSALASLVAEGPFMLLLEDIHLAPPEDQAAMVGVFGVGQGLTVVTTSLFEIDGLPGREVRLRALKHEEVVELVARMLGTSSPPGDLAALLYRETGGLPALVVQAVRELHGRGALRCEGLDDDGEPQWLLDAGVAQVGTFGLRPLFRQALADLSPSARTLLEVLAVAGDSLPVDVAITAAGVDPSGLDVANLQRMGIFAIEPREGLDWVSIRRPALVSLVYEALDPRHVEAIHRALAAAIEELPTSRWRDEAHGLHIVMGSEGEERARELLALGRIALQRGNLRRARLLLGYLAERPPEDLGLNAAVALLRGEVLMYRGAIEEARVAFVAARQLGREVHDAAVVAAATLGLARGQLASGSGIRCEALTLEAEKAGEGVVQEPLALCWSLYLKGFCSFLRGSDRNAIERMKAAAREAATLVEPELAISIRTAQAAIHAVAGRADRAERYLLAAFECMEGRPPSPAGCQAKEQVAELRISDGKLGSALDHLEQASQWARSLGQPYLEARIGVARARVHMTAGDLSGAASLLRRFRVAREARADVFTRLQHHVASGELRILAQDRQAALAAFDQATDLARKLGHAVIAAYGEGMTGVLTASAHPLEEALDVLEKVGARHYMARLLLAGAQVVADAAAVSAAVRVARQAGDKPVLLRALHVQGGEEVWGEAQALALSMQEQAGAILGRHVAALPEVRWALDSRARE